MSPPPENDYRTPVDLAVEAAAELTDLTLKMVQLVNKVAAAVILLREKSQGSHK